MSRSGRRGGCSSGALAGALEAGYGARAGEIAARLALHFERGGEVPRAVHYWQQAAENAARRNAHYEASTAMRKGLALLATWQRAPSALQHELALLLTLGELLRTTQGGVPGRGRRHGPIWPSRWGRRRSSCGSLEPVAVAYDPGADGSRRRVGAAAPELVQASLTRGSRSRDSQGTMAKPSGTSSPPGPTWSTAAASRTRCRPRAAPPGWFVSVHPRTPRAGASVVGARLCRAGLASAVGGADPGPAGGPYPHAERMRNTLWPRLPVLPRRGSDAGPCRRLAGRERRRIACPSALSRGASCGGGRWPCRARRPLGWPPPPGVGVSDVGPEWLRSYWLAALAEAYGRAGQPQAGLQVLAEAATRMAGLEARWWRPRCLGSRGVAAPPPS